MGENTAIGWTDHTFNPWHGCTNVSPGCDNCYAETFSKRTGRAQWGDDAPRWFPTDAYWRHPVKWNAAAQAAGRPALVFCASMADVFEDRPELRRHRARLFYLIEATPHLRWLLLTKRPENVLRLVPSRWIFRQRYALGVGQPAAVDSGPGPWPTNAAIGTTTDDQAHANLRIPTLLDIRDHAPMVFLSAEPLLGSIDLDQATGAADRIDWIIAGGESGPGHRPLDLEHALRLRDDAHLLRIPFFFKQVGGRHPTAGGDQLDGQTLKAFPAWAGDRTSTTPVEVRR